MSCKTVNPERKQRVIDSILEEFNGVRDTAIVNLKQYITEHGCKTNLIRVPMLSLSSGMAFDDCVYSVSQDKFIRIETTIYADNYINTVPLIIEL